MPTDSSHTRRRYLRLLAGGSLVGLAGCSGDQSENERGAADDTAPTESEANADGTPVDEPVSDSGESHDEPSSDSDEIEVVRLTPVEDPREVWRTGLTVIYPTDLQGWLREVATHDRTLRKRIETSQEMPNPPIRVLRKVRFVEVNDAPFVDNAGELTGYYDLGIEAGPYYEMNLDADPADPPSDAGVNSVEDLDVERRRLVIAAIEDSSDCSCVYSDTELAEWVRESFIDHYFRYEGETYRGYELPPTDTASSSTEAWYELSASPDREYDDATYLLLPDLEKAVRTELDTVGVRERTGELIVEDPSESLIAFADQISMLITHLSIFRVHTEAL